TGAGAASWRGADAAARAALAGAGAACGADAGAAVPAVRRTRAAADPAAGAGSGLGARSGPDATGRAGAGRAGAHLAGRRVAGAGQGGRRVPVRALHPVASGRVVVRGAHQVSLAVVDGGLVGPPVAVTVGERDLVAVPGAHHRGVRAAVVVGV